MVRFVPSKSGRLFVVFLFATGLLFSLFSLTLQANRLALQLLIDPGFESGATTFWTPSPGTTVFSITGSPVFSGSWAAAVSSNSASTKAIVQNVAGIIPGNGYTLSGYGYKDDPNVSVVRLRLAWYATSDCSGSQQATVDSNELTADSPAYVFLTTGLANAPPSAQCAQIRAQVQPLDANPASAYFDALSFIPAANPTATPTISATTTITPTATPSGTPSATPPPSASEGIIINEVAWAGTGASSSDEWLELYNVTTQTLSLNGWVITSTSGLNINLSGVITANSYFLLERTDDNTVSDIPADLIYSGSLGNDGDSLFLSNGFALVDSANGDGGNWPTGNASPDYASMERLNPLTPDSDTNWASNDLIHRNGLDADGNPINGTPRQANSTTYPPPTPTPTPPPPASEGIIINEVAWAGTGASSSDEWLELYNVTTQTLSLSGWVITSTGGLNINLSGVITANSYFLLERTDDNAISDIPADLIYSGSLGNDGDSLFLSNGFALVDSANGDGGSWPAGNASPDYASMERIDPFAPDADGNWRSNDLIHRNGLDADGNPINGTPRQANSTTYPPPTPTPTPPPTASEGIIINEVAWAGTGASSSDEWLELHNVTTQTLSLNGWVITSTGGLNIALSGNIAPGGYFLLERTDDNAISDIPADLIYSGSLGNDGDSLFLSNGFALVDSANADGGSWPAGNASPDYASMERVDPHAPDTDENWRSNDRLHRNGLDADGNPINGTPRQANSTTYPPPAVIPLLISEFLYDGLTPSTEGDEFAEICNPGPETANLTGYKIGDEETAGAGEGMYRFPDGLTLEAGNCLIIAKNAAHFFARFNLWPNFEVVTTGADYSDSPEAPNLTRYSSWGSGSWALTNHADELLLLGPSDQILDSVAWRGGDYTAVGLIAEGEVSAAEPHSLHRLWPSDSNWMPADFLRSEPNPGGFTPLPTPNFHPPASLPDGMFAYRGLLHSASTLSGEGAPPPYLLAQARANSLHFFGLTDPGQTLTERGWLATQNWVNEATIANQFVGLAGMKWANDEADINLFGLNEPVSPANSNTASLNDLYAYLAGQTNAVAQFNFSNEAMPLAPEAVSAMALQELALVDAPGESDTLPLLSNWLAGWRLGPTLNHQLDTLSKQGDALAYTGLIMPQLTQVNLLSALQARRVFASTDANFTLALRGNGQWMGSELPNSGPLQIEVFALDPDAEQINLTLYDRTIPLLNISAQTPFTWTPRISAQPGHFYWVQALQADGDSALTAPLWLTGSAEPENIIINELLPAPAETDWDGNGEANSEDEWLELLNPGATPVDLTGWWMQDEGNATYTFGTGSILDPGQFVVVYRQQSKIALNNDGDSLRLYRPDGSLADEVGYSADPGDDISVCRHPETREIHGRCIPTPGQVNIVLAPLGPLEVTIYEAKQATEGAWIKVEGYVTVPPGVFGVNVMYIQDDTHGIRLKLPSKHGKWFDIGDHVEVSGYLDLFYNEWELDIKDKGDIRKIDGHRFMAPLPIGGGLLREGYEGMLVQLQVYPTAFKKGGSHFWVEDETGLAYVYIYSKTGIRRRNVELGLPMTIVGIAGQRTLTQPPFDGYRLYPRSVNDIVQLQPAVAADTAEWPSTLPETGY